MRTARPPIDNLEKVPYYTSRTLLDLTELPEHLVVVGGGQSAGAYLLARCRRLRRTR
jgi:pyruvate/2-oxoglutarate dehydrogenase complex dihydrolipoamide dehydrogenase (E3) component